MANRTPSWNYNDAPNGPEFHSLQLQISLSVHRCTLNDAIKAYISRRGPGMRTHIRMQKVLICGYETAAPSYFFVRHLSHERKKEREIEKMSPPQTCSSKRGNTIKK